MLSAVCIIRGEEGGGSCRESSPALASYWVGLGRTGDWSLIYIHPGIVSYCNENYFKRFVNEE